MFNQLRLISGKGVQKDSLGRQSMKEFCRVCGRSIEAEDNIAWKYFGIICGGCFLPFAEHVLKNIEGMESGGKADQYAPGIHAEA